MSQTTSSESVLGLAACACHWQHLCLPALAGNRGARVQLCDTASHLKGASAVAVIFFCHCDCRSQNKVQGKLNGIPGAFNLAIAVTPNIDKFSR